MTKESQGEQLMRDYMVAHTLYELTHVLPEDEMHEPWGGLFRRENFAVMTIANC